ncbi:unnamed protein product [Gongylonema pulchrum]|uniref:Flavodoxin-like domain-containing protein n=1 Tax=Gongylonema pulchrum TaxID=637853 RepID=A0A183D3S8_9BILA|nr:unnamed protein product [Gongylonema pulchrum]
MSAHSARRSTLDHFVRAAEQDDLLLYITAAVGVFMPGCVYMCYQYAHKMYMRYAQRCEALKRENELERSAVTVFYAEGRKRTEELAHQVAAVLDCEQPLVVNLADIDAASFTEYKGIGLFLIDCAPNGRKAESVEWFFDFLEDLAFDKKSSSLPCSEMHFAVLGIGYSYNTNERCSRVCHTISNIILISYR